MPAMAELPLEILALEPCVESALAPGEFSAQAAEATSEPVEVSVESAAHEASPAGLGEPRELAHSLDEPSHTPLEPVQANMESAAKEPWLEDSAELACSPTETLGAAVEPAKVSIDSAAEDAGLEESAGLGSVSTASPNEVSQLESYTDSAHTAMALSELSEQLAAPEVPARSLNQRPCMHPTAGESSMQPCSFQESFLVCDGCIPAGGDLLVANMSVDSAKAKCKELPGCCGFTFNGHDTGGTLCIFFKSAWMIMPVQGRAWTSYRYAEAGKCRDACSAEMLALSALQPGSNVDFPRITELCHCAESNAHDMAVTVGLLVAVLCGPAGFREKLKVLTILNEMLYSREALSCLCDAPSLLTALADLRTTRDTELGSAADESIRMLATEIQKAVNGESPHSPASSPSDSQSGRSRRHLRLPPAPSASKVRHQLERTTSSMMVSAERTTTAMMASAERTTSVMLESAEKAATESISSALSNIEKGVDSTAATALTVQKAWKEVRSYVMAELPSLQSFKLRPVSSACWELSEEDDSPVDQSYIGGWTAERSPQIPSIEPVQVQWERQQSI